MIYASLALNSLTFLSLWRHRRKNMQQHKATRQHITKALHQHRVIEAGIQGRMNGSFMLPTDIEVTHE